MTISWVLEERGGGVKHWPFDQVTSFYGFVSNSCLCCTCFPLQSNTFTAFTSQGFELNIRNEEGAGLTKSTLSTLKDYYDLKEEANIFNIHYILEVQGTGASD